MNHPLQSVDEIFLEAIELRGPVARSHYLDRVCDGNPELRKRVEHLLEVASRVGTFLEEPACVATDTCDSTPIAELVFTPGQMIGPYKLIRLIGEGGMGFVYLAEQESPVRRNVALKVIRTGMGTSQIVSRFEQERQTLALMEHPNIARVLDAGATADGQPYFAMELVNGIPMTQFCDQQQLTIKERIEMFIVVCRAIQHAHQKGIIHRDLKPSNVLITQFDGRPVPKIIDFGVAKATGQQVSEQTLTLELGQIIGTLEYMAPEQAEPGNFDIDTRADVYALGGLLYELLAGTTPLLAGRLQPAGLIEMLRAIKEIEPDRPSEKIKGSIDLQNIAMNRRLHPPRLVHQVAGDLDWITMKCLEKDRARRFETANAVADDLERFLANQPVQACPPTYAYRWQKYARRHRMVLAGSATIFAILILATIFSIHQAVLASRAEARAVEGWAEADQQRLQSDAVNEFMYEFLTKVNPGQKGADARLVDVLEDASVLASIRFEGSPQQEARIRSMLAECFSSLAMVDKAARETGLAVKLLQSALDPADRSLLQAELRHVRALLDVQRPRKAKVLVETLIPMVHNVFEPGHPVVLEAETMAANVHLKLGNIEQAQLELRELRERAAEIGANDDIQFDILRSLVIALRSGLGVEPRNSPLIEETASLAREATERSTRLWGPNDLRSLQARLFLADLLCKQGEFHDSAATCEEILGTSENDLGKQHSLRLKAMDVLAMDRHRLGNSSEAADLQLQVIEGARSNSENPIQLIADISDSLPILDRGNRWAEGEALATEYKVELEKLGGGHGDFMFNARLYIARFCSLQRRIEQAEDQFQALFAQAELHTPEAPVLARLHLFYADHLRQRECFEQAEHHLQIAAASVDDIRLGTNVTNPDDIISAFIALYEAWGKPDPMTEYQNLLRQVQGYTAGDKPVISND